MITTNVSRRTFRIKYADAYGTCFTIDVEGKQYLVTAKHVLEGISASAVVEIFYQNNWYSLSVELVGEAPGRVDIVVLAPSMRLSPSLPLPATMGGIAYAQDVYFLGFPYNLFGDFGEPFPAPFVKKGILSMSLKSDDGVHELFLDGHNNPGFSGGPVVWTKPGQNVYSVAGVISSYRYENEPVYAGEVPTTLAYRYNTGIIIAYAIEHATQLIERNPIGYDVS